MKNQSQSQMQQKDNSDYTDSYYFNRFFADNKDIYTKEEIIHILESVHGQYLGKVMLLEFEKINMQENKENWDSEHGKSLALLIENEMQRISLEEIHDKLKMAYKEMETLSTTDPLTHLLNRRALIDLAEKEIQRVLRVKESLDYYIDNKKNMHRRTSDKLYEFKSTRQLEDYVGVLSVAIIDIDYFKKVNDTYGHLVGDQVLTEIGKTLCKKNLLRLTDVVGRFGGEEFLIIFPDTSSRNALFPLNKLIEYIRRQEIKTKDGDIVRVTVSIGVSEYSENDKSINDIIKRADVALYAAKDNGRDQIISYEHDILKQKGDRKEGK
jgi:diguanylate cyclase (GGDEF)-like protein